MIEEHFYFFNHLFMSNKGKSHLLSGILIGTVLGSMYSMLFAQKKGATLRKELQDTHKKGGNLFEVIAKEFKLTGKESAAVMRELFASEEFQKFMKESQEKMDELVQVAKKKGGKYTKEMQQKFEHLAHMASEKATTFGENMKEKGEEMLQQGKKSLDNVLKDTKKKSVAFRKKIIKK
jgi:gas vesicle protein